MNRIIALCALLGLSGNMFGASNEYIAEAKAQFEAEQKHIQEDLKQQANMQNRNGCIKWAKNSITEGWNLVPTAIIIYKYDQNGFQQPYFFYKDDLKQHCYEV